MKRLLYLVFTLVIISCEDVVIVEVPTAQNLLTVEGWVTNITEHQTVRLTRSNSFISNREVEPIADASVVVQSRLGQTNLYSHVANGLYQSNEVFAANPGTEYRVRIQLSDGSEINSDWELMPDVVPLNLLSVDSFEENDPDNPGQQFLIYFPRVIAVDPENRQNFYRWRFFKNGEPHIEAESITIQDDRFFDGNLIPNNFRSFGYEAGDQMVVQFQSISQEAYNFLSLLKAQITSLGTSSGTTPAQVPGNLTFEASDERILGYFGAVAVSADTTVVVE